MPYLIVPKGQPHIHVFLAHLPFIWSIRHHDYWETYSGAYENFRCSCCLRLMKDTATARVMDYRLHQCETCITAVEVAPGRSPNCARSYLTRVDALHDCDTKTQEIVFRPSPAETDVWQSRSQRRFNTGEWKDIPWSVSGECSNHYTHIAYEKPGQVAFYRDEESGVLDKLTYMKPGRYLTEFYPTMDAAQMAEYIAHVTARTVGTYTLATTPEDISRIYNTAKGPDSCMRRKTSAEYDWQPLLDSGRMPCHPCAVYGNSDLALAYTGPIDAISQRAIVWPEKKRFVRIYGTGPLRHLLLRDGYNPGSFAGAKIRRVRFRDPESGESALVTPYVDREQVGDRFAADSADIQGDWLILRGESGGDVYLGETRGHTSDDIHVEERDTVICDACDSEVGAENARDGLCESCWANRYFECHDCDSVINRDDDESTISPRGHWYCESCIARQTQTCAYEGCDETFIESFRSTVEQRERRSNAVSQYCDEHAREMLAPVLPPPDTTSVTESPTGLFEVHLYRGTYRSNDTLDRYRPDGWYLVQLDYQTYSGTLDICQSVMARLQENYPNSPYRIQPAFTPMTPEASTHDIASV